MKNPNHYSTSPTLARLCEAVRSIGVTQRAPYFFTLPLLAALGCAANANTNTNANTPAVAVNAGAAANGASAKDASVATPSSSPSGARPLPEAVSALAAEGVTGAIALFDAQSGSLYCSDDSRCTREYLPASTFK